MEIFPAYYVVRIVQNYQMHAHIYVSCKWNMLNIYGILLLHTSIHILFSLIYCIYYSLSVADVTCS